MKHRSTISKYSIWITASVHKSAAEFGARSRLRTSNHPAGGKTGPSSVLKKPLSHLGIASLLAVFAFAFLGCSRPSDAELARLATRYRDDWIASEHPEDAEQLRLGVIQSIEHTSEGWLFIFITETGHEHPTGMHDYFLHVLVDRKGKLIRVVRAPDRLS